LFAVFPWLLRAAKSLLIVAIIARLLTITPERFRRILR